MNRRLAWSLFLAPFVMVLCLAFAYSAQAKPRSGGSHKSSTPSSPSPSRPSSSPPSANNGGSNRPASNNRPRPRRVVVVKRKGPQSNRPIRPRGQYRRQVIGGRPFLRQGNRLYTQRCCLRGRPYLVYYGNVAKPHKSHTWLWVLLGVVALVGILAAVFFLVIRRRP